MEKSTDFFFPLLHPSQPYVVLVSIAFNSPLLLYIPYVILQLPCAFMGFSSAGHSTALFPILCFSRDPFVFHPSF